MVKLAESSESSKNISVKELIQCFEELHQAKVCNTNMGYKDSKLIMSIPRIVVDDFDSSKENKDQKISYNGSTGTTPRIYTRSYSDASIKKILEEAETRKHEFWKLLDEHNAVIENLKRIEKFETKVV